ncbi:MAG: hypothetical protein CMH82_14925 [Nocardioides sp.]|nr:hypothetical protein [Nocardioides sp.]
MVRRVAVFEPGHLSKREKRELRQEIARTQYNERPIKASRRERALPEPAIPGPFGPGITEGGYWNLARPLIAAHQATSRQIAGIYPFVADAGLGHRGPILGVDLNADALWHFSPWQTYSDKSDRGTLSTNVLVLGAYRAGKSATVKCLVMRSLAFGHQAVVPSDPKGEWVKVAEAVPGSVVIRIGGGSAARLNPLDRGPRRTGADDDQHEKMVRQRRITTLASVVEMALGAKLTAVEHAALHEALERSIRLTADHPTLRSVYEQLGAIVADAGTDFRLSDGAVQPRFVLRRFVEGDLSGLFEDESTVSFDAEAPIVVVDTSELFSRSELVAQLTQVCTTSWIQAVVSDRSAGRTRYLIREEGWRDMTSLAALQMFQQWLKLSRHYGISNIVILHKMGDLDAVGDSDSKERNLAYSIAGDIENKFIFRANQQEATALTTRLGIPTTHVDDIRRLRKGVFLAYIGQYAYAVDCFATSTPWEFDLFDTDDAIVRTENDDGMLRLIDADELDRYWPEDSPADASLDGWLSPTWKEAPR